MTWRSSTMLLFSMCGIARGSSQRLRTGHWLSPVVNRMTSWPALLRPRASRSMTASVPPYPSGGPGSRPVDQSPAGIAAPEAGSRRGDRMHDSVGQPQPQRSVGLDVDLGRGAPEPDPPAVVAQPQAESSPAGWQLRVDPEYPAVDSDPGEAGGNCLPEAAEGGDVQAAGRGVGEVAQVQVRGHPQ